MQIEGARQAGVGQTSQAVANQTVAGDKRRRFIPHEQGRALEILGHAIEYLADSYALSAEQQGSIDSGAPEVAAIHLLMAANREVYYSCPQVEPRFGRTWLSWLRRWALARSGARLQTRKSPA